MNSCSYRLWSAEVKSQDLGKKLKKAGQKPKQRLPTGTSSTGTNGLTSKDICRIISVCRKNKVESFKLDGLELSFSGGPKRTLDREIENESSHSESSVVQGKSEPVESVITLGDEEALEMAIESQLLIEDPLAHETLMIDRNLRKDARRYADT